MVCTLRQHEFGCQYLADERMHGRQRMAALYFAGMVSKVLFAEEGGMKGGQQTRNAQARIDGTIHLGG